MTRLNSPSLLHPAFAERLQLLVAHLQAEDPGFQAYETVRPPERQVEMHSAGRSRAAPYQSAHQFGVAADIVFCDGGMWRWPAKDDPRWEPLIRLAPQFGLECLSWERPHVQMEGFDWRHLAPGPMGTAEWTEWLANRNKETT